MQAEAVTPFLHLYTRRYSCVVLHACLRAAGCSGAAPHRHGQKTYTRDATAAPAPAPAPAPVPVPVPACACACACACTLLWWYLDVHARAPGSRAMRHGRRCACRFPRRPRAAALARTPSLLPCSSPLSTAPLSPARLILQPPPPTASYRLLPPRGAASVYHSVGRSDPSGAHMSPAKSPPMSPPPPPP